jgi:hypothetical protein
MVERFWIEDLKKPYTRKIGDGRLFNFVWVKNNFVLFIWIFLCCDFFLSILIHIYETSCVVMEIFYQSSYIYVWNLSWNLWILLCNFIHLENLLCLYVDFFQSTYIYLKPLVLLWTLIYNPYRYVWNFLCYCEDFFVSSLNVLEMFTSNSFKQDKSRINALCFYAFNVIFECILCRVKS